MPRLAVRLALAALAAGVVWLAFTAGGARLLAWRLTHVAGVPVDVRRLGIELGPRVLVGGAPCARLRLPQAGGTARDGSAR